MLALSPGCSCRPAMVRVSLMTAVPAAGSVATAVVAMSGITVCTVSLGDAGWGEFDGDPVVGEGFHPGAVAGLRRAG